MYRVIPMMMLALVAAVTVTAADGEATPQGVVNVNTATAEQLQLLPRVGPALSQRILDFRDDNGPFASADELIAVRGIGERSLEQLRPYVSIDGKTTLDIKVRLPRRSGDEAAE
jgi:competence protein ComEA